MFEGETVIRASKTGVKRRKPRIALMGEFSAGKSTLSNLLLGRNPLPVRITATSVPPIWISYGDDAAIRVRQDGSEEELDIEELTNASLEDTRLIRLFLKTEILELCDILDMPGISDPNMAHDVWNNVIDLADSVIWCTHATQAWRQSEASVWEEIAGRMTGENVLVLTQFDKLRNERDKSRVLARTRKETDGAFEGMFPLSLLDALNAGDDIEAWRASGAAEFTEYLVSMLLRRGLVPDDAATEGYAPVKTDSAAEAPVEPDETESTPSEPPAKKSGTGATSSKRILPNRVQVKSDGSTRARPSRYSAMDCDFRRQLLAQAHEEN